MAELQRKITADQRQLIQFGDEKMALACIAVDLVDLHMQQLDKDLGALQAEMEVCFNAVTRRTYIGSSCF